MSHWLYISPHLDDAVLSCGATMYQKIKQGDRVTVLTVFTACSDNKANNKGIYGKRKQDDIKAGRLLGFDAIHLDLLDAPYRSSQYNSFYSIMFSKMNNSGIRKFIQMLIDQLQTLIYEKAKPDYVVFPLGVGGHIDHKIVFAASREIVRNVEVSYYEERPYAFIPAAVASRWYEIFREEEILSPECSDLEPIDWGSLNLPFLQNYMVDERDKNRSYKALTQAYNKLSVQTRQRDEWTDGNDTWKRKMLYADEEAVAMLFRAIDNYHTEMADLFNCCYDMTQKERIEMIKSVFYSANIDKLYFHECIWERKQGQRGE